MPKYANKEAFHKIIRHSKTPVLLSRAPENVSFNVSSPCTIWQVAHTVFLGSLPIFVSRSRNFQKHRSRKLHQNLSSWSIHLIRITVLSVAEWKVALYVSHVLYCTWRALDHSGHAYLIRNEKSLVTFLLMPMELTHPQGLLYGFVIQGIWTHLAKQPLLAFCNNFELLNCEALLNTCKSFIAVSGTCRVVPKCISPAVGNGFRGQIKQLRSWHKE